MKIKRIRVKNFRSLKDVTVEFEDGLTCIVGENDSGKTSLIDCIRIFSEVSPCRVNVEDFYKYTVDGEQTQEREIEIQIDLSDGTSILKKFLKNDESVAEERKVFYVKERIEEEISRIESSLSDDQKDKRLRELEDSSLRDALINLATKTLGGSISQNKKVLNLIRDMKNKIAEVDSSHIESTSEHKIYVYCLDNRTIESPEKTIEELFLRELGKEVWEAVVDESGTTIKQLVEKKIENMREEKEREFKNKVEQKLSEFLNEEAKIKIEANLKEAPIGIDFKSSIVNKYGEEILFKNKGDGTKRRITMAMVELKLQERSNDRDINIFIFDEPDTHLHVRAQRNLLELLKKYSRDKQIIITSHSPFILNLLKPSQIRALHLWRDEGSGKSFTRVQVLKENVSNVERLLSNLGVENTLLFFAKKILITEEKTLRVFLEHLYFHLHDMPIHGDFIKIIEGRGVTDAPRLAKVILEDFEYNKDQVILVVDNDIDNRSEEDPIYQILEALKSRGWDIDSNFFKIGNREFEDCFKPEQIYEAWKMYVEKEGRNVGNDWTLENVTRVYQECMNSNEKLRNKLKNLNSGCGVRFNHADTFPKALAEYFSEHPDQLPEEIKSLLNRLREEGA